MQDLMMRELAAVKNVRAGEAVRVRLCLHRELTDSTVSVYARPAKTSYDYSPYVPTAGAGAENLVMHTPVYTTLNKSNPTHIITLVPPEDLDFIVQQELAAKNEAAVKVKVVRDGWFKRKFIQTGRWLLRKRKR